MNGSCSTVWDLHPQVLLFDPCTRRQLLGCKGRCGQDQDRENIFIELMTSDRKLKTSREGSK